MKISPKILLSMLLVLSATPLLVTQTVSSQSYTTLTSWTTITSQSTSISYSTFVVATTTPTSNVTLTYDYTFTLPELSQSYCYYDEFNGTFNAGDRLVGKVVTNSVMDFYVMSSDQFQTFSHAHCVGNHPAYVHAPNVVSSYSLDWVVPADGTYHFVFFNYASSGQGAGQVIGTIDLQYPGSQSVTLTLYSTSSSSNVFVVTQTIGSLYSTTISSLFAWINANPLYVVIGIIALVGVVGVIIVLTSPKRTSKPTAAKAKGKVKAAVAVEAEAEPVTVRKGNNEPTMMFCKECGRKIPRDSKFCKECGSAQS